MAKRLKVDDTPSQVKDFLKQLEAEKGEYVLEMEGKPFLGIVSPWQAEQLSLRREEILALLRQSWERNRAVQEEEIQKVVSETIQEVRRGQT